MSRAQRPTPGGVRWPAEWAPHDATWIAWPHHEPDWPGKLELIPWVYAEIVRVLSAYERVDILVQNADVEAAARTCLDAHRANPGRYRRARQRTDRSGLRDSAPTGVHDAGGRLAWLNWGFNAWAKYQNFDDDVHIGECVARVTHATRVEPQREAGKGALILEGGGIETDG